MAVNQRTLALAEIWARTANTSIPLPPTTGVSYRDTSLSAIEIARGQAYKSIGDSAAWNQYLWQISGLIQMSEQYGIMPYSSSTTYKEKALALYTDGILYRSKMDVPRGTPCTNTAYWEIFTPDGTTELPPISVGGGATFYVDYRKSSSGDGLTQATAFKNFYECFSAIREKYSGVNSIFNTYTVVPLFKIIAYGNTNQTIENGPWRIQNMSLEFNLQTNFIHPQGGIWIQGSVVSFTAPSTANGGLTINGAFNVMTSTVTAAAKITVNNGYNTAPYDFGCALRLSSSSFEVPTGFIITLNGLTPLNASGSHINVFGTLKGTGSSRGVYMILSDLYISGTCHLDCSIANGATTTYNQFLNSTIRLNGELACKGLHLRGGLGQMDAGRLVLGSFINTTSGGLYLQSGAAMEVATNVTLQQWNYPPLVKGGLYGNSSLVSWGKTQINWPGGGSFAISQNSSFFSA